MSIALDALELIDAPKIRRDRWGRYLVLAPGATKPVGYTRATTVAKATDDESNLMGWSGRMVALGLAARADLLAAVRTADPDDRQALNGIVDKAKEAGGATVRRDLGTALHGILERALTEADYLPPAAYAADVRAVRDALAAHGFSVVAGMTERMVVNDTHQIAGMFDLIVERDGVLHIADFKTGSSVAYGAVAWAIQLAIYATADALYRQGAAADGSEDVREPMPEVDRSTAFVIHVQPESGACDIHALDIAAGAEALDVALAVRSVRKLKPLTKITGPAPDAVAEVGFPSPDAGATASVGAGGPGSPHAYRRAWLQGRIDVVAAVPEQKATLARCWPRPTPTLKESEAHTEEQLAAIEATLDRVEGLHEIPFGATDPAKIPAPPPQPAPPAPPAPWTAPDEGPFMTAEDMAAMRKKIAALDVGVQSLIGRWMEEGDKRGRPWGTTDADSNASTRRFQLLRCAIALADLADGTTAEGLQAVRDVLGVVLGEELQPAMRTGMAIGSLSTEQAGHAHTIATAIRRGQAITFADDGTPVVA